MMTNCRRGAGCQSRNRPTGSSRNEMPVVVRPVVQAGVRSRANRPRDASPSWTRDHDRLRWEAIGSGRSRRGSSKRRTPRTFSGRRGIHTSPGPNVPSWKGSRRRPAGRCWSSAAAREGTSSISWRPPDASPAHRGTRPLRPEARVRERAVPARAVRVRRRRDAAIRGRGLRLVLCRDLLHHLEDREPALRELARVLKPGAASSSSSRMAGTPSSRSWPSSGRTSEDSSRPAADHADADPAALPRGDGRGAPAAARVPGTAPLPVRPAPPGGRASLRESHGRLGAPVAAPDATSWWAYIVVRATRAATAPRGADR